MRPTACPCEHEQKVDVKDTKEKNTIKTLQKQIMIMTCSLHGAEEMIALREKEVSYHKFPFIPTQNEC